MRLHPCFTTGVYMAVQSFFYRGAAFRGLGSSTCSVGLRAGWFAGRASHHHLRLLANPAAKSAHRRRSGNMMTGSRPPAPAAADPRGGPIHELATSSGRGGGGDDIGGSGRRRSKNHRRRRFRSGDEKDGRQTGKAGGGGSPPRGLPGDPRASVKGKKSSSDSDSASEGGDVRRRRSGRPTANKRKKQSSTADENRVDKNRRRRGRSPRQQRGGGGGGGGGGVPELPLFGLDIPEDRVHVVDTPEGMRDAAAVLGRSVVMSIDTETQPSFAVGEWHPTSLLQLATRDADGAEDVLVIDLLSLKDGLLLPESLSEALSGPFGSPSVVKLGVGLANDFDEMSFAFQKTPFLEQVPGVLNLNALHAKLTGGACDDQGIPRDLGLRKLASMYLGRSLSKKQQMSRWARRPLRHAQVTYAACDALVALRVFDALLLALGSLDVRELCSTWTPRSYSEKGLGKEKVVRLRRKLAARASAVGREHIRYETGDD